MGVEVVHPEEEGAVAALARSHRSAASVTDRALRSGGRRCARQACARREVVMVEALVEPEPRVEHEAGDESRGLVPALPQNLGRGPRFWREAELAVGPHAVAGRVDPGQNGGVRRQRHRHRRVGVGEARPPAASASSSGVAPAPLP